MADSLPAKVLGFIGVLAVPVGIPTLSLLLLLKNSAGIRDGKPIVQLYELWYAPLYIFEHLVGENIDRYPMPLTILECQVSELVDSDACRRVTTGPGGGGAVAAQGRAAARGRGRRRFRRRRSVIDRSEPQCHHKLQR